MSMSPKAQYGTAFYRFLQGASRAPALGTGLWMVVPGICVRPCLCGFTRSLRYVPWVQRYVPWCMVQWVPWVPQYHTGWHRHTCGLHDSMWRSAAMHNPQWGPRHWLAAVCQNVIQADSGGSHIISTAHKGTHCRCLLVVCQGSANS